VDDQNNPTGVNDPTDDEYELTAEDAFARLSPDERRRFGRMMKQEGRKRNVDFADVDDDDDDDAKYDNPKKLAKMARRSKKKDPGMLGNLLESFTGGGGAGGGGGGKDSGGIADLAKTALKKIT
jgi:hypothetical protein